LSPRAAWRLESLGFRGVFDYAAGKQDWLAAGLPVEGALAGIPRAGTVARADVPTCVLDEDMATVKARVSSGGWEVCVAVNDQRIVLGLLRARELQSADELTVAQAMRPGPSTFRPNVPIHEMAEYMAEHELASSPITTSDGRLVGILLREDAERATHEFHQAVHEGHADG
jgi:CBS domain-containing protein